MAQSLDALAVGALVKDTGTLYNGKPIIWKIADKGHTGYPSGAVTLITERIISLKCFDAIESGNSDGDRRSYGNNRWTLSNVRQWLNSRATAGKWYSAQHGADAPPTNANVWSTYNEYDAEAGFLAGFSANFIAALLTTTHTVGKATVDGGGTESCADKIFLATCTEVGLSGDVTAGSKLALFSNDSSRLAYPTAEAVSKSEYTNSSLNVNSPWWWWLADAYASISCAVRSVDSSGAMDWTSLTSATLGVRPLCNLSSGILVSDRPDSDGAYTIIWNRAPRSPLPSRFRPAFAAAKACLSVGGFHGRRRQSFRLYPRTAGQRRRMGAGIQGHQPQLHRRNHVGWTSIAYRVKAYDSAGAESAYQTSATRTVVNNHAPVISGTVSNLGTKTAAFAQSYSVTDEDSGQTLTVTEYIDGTQKRSYTATSGQTYSFNITAAEWVKLLNGSHTLKIVAADNYGGSATRTYTFTKNETEIELTLATPLTADDMVTKGIMSVVRQIPAGAKFTVEVCNNGNDASPTWEDVTQNVVSGSKFFLSNTTKTASAWGYNFRIKVKRGTATGDCFITSAGGDFE